MKKVKKVVALIFALCMAFNVFASAAGLANVQVMSSNGNIASARYTFDFNTNTGKAVYDADIDGVSGTSSVYVAIVIQRDINGTWTNVPGTFLSSNRTGEYAGVGGTKYVEKGYWYRAQATFIATKNGVQTKEVKNSSQYWYN